MNWLPPITSVSVLWSVCRDIPRIRCTRYTESHGDIIIILFQAPALTVIARRRNSQVAYPVGLRRKSSRAAGAGKNGGLSPLSGHFLLQACERTAIVKKYKKKFRRSGKVVLIYVPKLWTTRFLVSRLWQVLPRKTLCNNYCIHSIQNNQFGFLRFLDRITNVTYLATARTQNH